MKRIHISRGLDIAKGAVAAPESMRLPTTKVALLGCDYPGVRPELAVETGQKVGIGEVLFTDRAHPALRFCATAAGVVSAIHLGARRSLHAVVIDVDDDTDEVAVTEPLPGANNAEDVRDAILAFGLWPILRARPYDVIPPPDACAEHLFITALDTQPYAPDPQAIILPNKEAFVAGIEHLRLLADHTFVCMAADADIPYPQGDDITPVAVAGCHPAGLAGTHIHHLAPGSSSAWHVGYQDVIAVGHLFLTGRLSVSRTVSVAGAHGVNPYQVATRLGAATAELASPTLPSSSILTSGSPLAQRRERLVNGFLGRYHNQVCVQPGPTTSQAKPLSFWLRAILSPRHASEFDSAETNPQTGMLAIEAFDEVWPFHVPPAPLLRALLSRDTETALNLGAIMMAEEDLALCSYVCPAKQDYGRALRETLAEIERGD